MEDISSKTKFVVDERGGGIPSDYSFLVAEGSERCPIRTRSEQEWPRSTFYDRENDHVHFISYNSADDSYLLETAFRNGSSHERREAQRTVEEIKAEIGDAVGTEEIVALLFDSLEKKDDAFPPRPEIKDEDIPKRRPRIERGDILFPVRAAHGLSEEMRDKLRKMHAGPRVKQSDLPPGSIFDRRNEAVRQLPPGAVKVVMPDGEERVVEPPFEVQGPPKQV